jgi:hypothetical protein
MMTWSYRVFREEDGGYAIREVFYAENGSILGCTANAAFGRNPTRLTTDNTDDTDKKHP